MRRTLLFSLGMMLLAGTASAQTSFTEDFSSGTLGPNLMVTSVSTAAAGTAADAATFAALFNGAGDGGRSFVGTVDSNFASAGFQAQVDVTVPVGGGANGFFGLGPGIVGGTGDGSAGPAFGEPSTGPAIFVGLNEDGRDNGEANLSDASVGVLTAAGEANSQISNTNGNRIPDPLDPTMFIFQDSDGDGVNDPQFVVGSGSHVLFLDYDLSAQTLEISADIGSVGTVTSLGTFNTADNGFDATNARIFFGGDDGTAFDNFSVTVEGVAVPEPASAALLGFGVLGSMFVRRRRG